MTYDDMMDGRQEQFDREDAAEAHRVQREASRAFAQADGLAVARRIAARLPRRIAKPATRLSAARQAQVAHASAVIAAMGTDGYALAGMR
jgi:hypothetical protein